MENEEETSIRDRLRALAAAGHPEPAGGAAAFIEANLELLGSLDPELRDSLFYEAAAEWIGRGLVGPAAMEALAARLLSRDFLFFGLGEAEGDRVFRRSFSALILDCLLKRTMAAGGLSPEAVSAIADSMGDYATRERDLRGFVPGKGWAHAPAHAADVLASLAAATTTDEAGCERVLEATRRFLLAGKTVFAHQE
ncbi:MAG: DUF2785 domain-containing protein, partial [Spirochaetaceae bacterium]|nr:DUF2785 domain-containing protein [Spirochaetaceae bacterium]